MIALLLAAALADPAARLEALDWMVGAWVEVRGEATTREVWQPPAGGVMTGVNEARRGDRPAVVEHMTIATTPEGVIFTALLPGQPPTAFRLRPGPEGEAVFENPEHDFPQRVIYRRCEADLCARIEGVRGGETVARDWRFQRAP